MIKIGKKVFVDDKFSINSKQEEVIIKDINFNDLTCIVEYSWGYTETLPITALIA